MNLIYKKKNYKAFTLIELLAVIVILAVIALIATPIILNIIDNFKKEALRISTYNLIDAANKAFISTMLERKPIHTIYVFDDGIETIQQGNILLRYNGEMPKKGTIEIDVNGEVAIALYNGKYCSIKNYNDREVTIQEISEEECTIITSIVSHDGWDEGKLVNSPELAAGLTPVYWNGSQWVPTTSDNPNWYNYDITNKQWANAISKDGSLWVWIPRFAYQISSNYNTNSSTGGEIRIKFLMGNSDDVQPDDNTVVELNPTYDGSSQTNYVVHPAFKFGNTQLTGFWVAKFEATAANNGVSNLGLSCETQDDNVTNKKIAIIPGVPSWRCISVSNAFINSYNMQLDTETYGWNDVNVDTHLIKNNEWGAVAYLSQSNYGKGTSNIWMNPNKNYTTGCAGTNAGQSQTPECNAYYTPDGVKASTTFNFYGVYDMSGGSAEMTAAHVDNITIGSDTYISGQALIEADSKYRDIYPLAPTDTDNNNYLESYRVFGDGVWETSNAGSNNNGWYTDITNMPNTTSPWFIRGGHNRNYNAAGLYGFANHAGGGSIDFGFRPVLLVGKNI